jgi:tetratricopeptide (TPR) repeat protein
LIGDIPNAISIAEKALNNSQALKVKSEILAALTILVGMTGLEKYLKPARELVAGEKYSRNRLKLEFSYIQYLMEFDFVNDAGRLIGPLAPQLLNQSMDVEIPRLLNIAGAVMLKLKDFNEAKGILDKSFDAAKSLGLLLDELNAGILLGNVAMAGGGYELAFSNYKSALQLCKQIVGNIGSDTDKKLFMNQPNIKLLVSEINRLGDKLAAKSKAGV